VCRGCNRHVLPGAGDCPFCGGSIPALAERYAQNLELAARARQRLETALRRLDS
jgi:hypothetical protein